MATNAISVLSQADSIILFREGKVVETGLFAEVMDKPNSEICQLTKMTGNEQLDSGEKTEDEKDPLAKTADEEDNFEHHAGNKFDHSLRRVSTPALSYRHWLTPTDIPGRLKSTPRRAKSSSVCIRTTCKLPTYSSFCFSFYSRSHPAMAVGGNVWLKHWSDMNT
ncbi:hypothetical protein V1520DRAFT_13653 [Lipomyces starkeyi]